LEGLIKKYPTSSALEGRASFMLFGHMEATKIKLPF
jgi:hypothetical protein